jgi:hypothetical protein
MKTILLLFSVLFMVLCASAQADVRITMVDTDYQVVELTNFGDASADVSNWFLCNFPAYMEIAFSPAIIGNTNLGPNDTVLINWSALTPADGELGLYLFSTFNNASFMLDYMQWGTNNHVRESVAIAASVWVDDEFLTLGSPYNYEGPLNQIGEAVWSSTIGGCTYADAINFDPVATVDSGDCVSTCSGDFNGDDVIDTSDLLSFLGAFGTICVQ